MILSLLFGNKKTGSPTQESLLVCAGIANIKSYSLFLINQQRPTTPILGETEVGEHLALASKAVVTNFVYPSLIIIGPESTSRWTMRQVKSQTLL